MIWLNLESSGWEPSEGDSIMEEEGLGIRVEIKDRGESFETGEESDGSYKSFNAHLL